MLRPILLGLFACSFLAARLHADVLVVAPSGGQFSTIQLAADVSAPGDVILVRPGIYDTLTINAKGITIVADPAESVTVQYLVRVTNLPAGQRLTLSGLKVPPGRLQFQNNQGSIRLEGLKNGQSPTLDIGDFLDIRNCADVAVYRCDLLGSTSGQQFSPPPASGSFVLNSNVAIFDSVVTGGWGGGALHFGAGGASEPARAGAPGCIVMGTSQVVLSGCIVRGGQGGSGLAARCQSQPMDGGPGEDGGDGIEIDASSTVYLRDTMITPGTAGPGGLGGCGGQPGQAGVDGAPVTGVATVLPGTRRVLTCATHLRELDNVTLDLVGEPGDFVILNVGTSSQWALDVPVGGVRLVGPSSRRLNVGMIPASGTLSVALPIPDLGSGVASRTFHLQAYFRHLAGATHVGSGAVLVALDSAY